MTPKERRLEAIGNTVDYLMDRWTDLKPGVHRSEAAAKIRELLPMGRTQTWKTAVETWASLVEDEDHPLKWAITQGAIFTGFRT